MVETYGRIAKYMAAAGLCSRREAERWILDGRVQVNHSVIDSPALNVTDEDKITVDGRTVSKSTSKPRVFRFHKPAGVVCTNNDEFGRRTIFDLLPQKGLPRLVAVGRLDMNSEGLIILTDTPWVASKLMKPSDDMPRIYRARISGNLSYDQIERLEKGMKVDGIQYRPAMVEIESEENMARNSWIRITLHEGKNREIRNLMRALGLEVSRLQRVKYGDFELGRLPKNAIDEVPYKYIEPVLNKLEN